MRISWSILNAWERGDKDSVENMVLRLPTVRSEAMQKGIDVHEYIATNKIQVMDFFSDTTQFEGEGKNKFEAKFGEDVLVGIIDIYDPVQSFLCDFKVSKRSAGSQNESQLLLYNLLLGLAGEKMVDTGYMIQIDPNREISDVQVLSYAKHYIADKDDLDDIYFWMKRSVREIKDYFLELGVEI